jgi:hypothetical protein
MTLVRNASMLPELIIAPSCFCASLAMVPATMREELH